MTCVKRMRVELQTLFRLNIAIVNLIWMEFEQEELVRVQEL